MRRKNNMKKWSWVLTMVVALSLLPARDALAQFKPESGSIDGYMVAEYYYLFSTMIPRWKARTGSGSGGSILLTTTS